MFPQSQTRIIRVWIALGLLSIAGSHVGLARNRVDPNGLSGSARTAFQRCDELASSLASSDKDTQSDAARNLLKAASAFSAANPDVFRGWVWQAQAALALDREAAGREAAKNMLALGADQSKSDRILAILAALEVKGWLQPPDADQPQPAPPATITVEKSSHPLSGIINSSDGTANLRREQSKDSDLLETLENGASVAVLSQDGEWWTVRTATGHTGFMKKSLIRLSETMATPEPAGVRGVISSSDGTANLRREQSRDSEVLESVENGASVTVLSQDGDWWMVRTLAGQRGYIHKSLVATADQPSEAGASADETYQLAEKLRRGDDGSPDLARALELYRRAAETGHARAQHRLGVFYATGKGVAQNDDEAVKWYRRSAEGGYAEAQHDLAVRYVLGKGVEKDEARALAWYRKAAAQGDADSIETLRLRGIEP